jgi:hypothetical protein
MSATTRLAWPRSSLPFWRATSGGRPGGSWPWQPRAVAIMNRPPPRRAIETSSTPTAPVPSGPANKSRPSTPRRWWPWRTLVIELVRPTQGPSSGRQESPPRPASATYRAPWRRSRPRGLLSRSATTVTPRWWPALAFAADPASRSSLALLVMNDGRAVRSWPVAGFVRPSSSAVATTGARRRLERRTARSDTRPRWARARAPGLASRPATPARTVPAQDRDTPSSRPASQAITRITGSDSTRFQPAERLKDRRSSAGRRSRGRWPR